MTSRVSDELETALTRWAAEEGRQRSDLIREILTEGWAAHQQGRALFERPETLSPADLQRLIGELVALRIEIDRVLRRSAERDAALAKSARDDTVGISEARTAIVSQVAVVIDRQLQTLLGAIAALSAKIDNPPAVAAMHEDLRALRAEIGDNRAADLAITKEGQAEIIRETRKRRAWFMVNIDDKSWSTALLIIFGLMCAIAGLSLLLIMASIFPSVGLPTATRLLHGDREVCQMLDQRYGVTDCTVPRIPHMRNKPDTVSVPVPRVHRTKRR